MTADERLALINTKVERAKKHIADLYLERRAFLDTNPYAVDTKRNPQTRQLIYYMARVDPAPIALATVAGDIFQNLRSALDHLAYQLFLIGTNGSGPKGNRVYFPIARDATAYRREAPQKIKGLRKEAIDAIDAIEPYGGGKGNELWILQALNKYRQASPYYYRWRKF
jgi:hypothetical protein